MPYSDYPDLCQAACPTAYNYRCTLPLGHAGDHASGSVRHARTGGADGEVYFTWQQRERAEEQEEEDPMAMTRADYDKIATILSAHKPDVKSGTVGEKRLWTKLARALMTEFARANPRFDPARFQRECDFPAE